MVNDKIQKHSLIKDEVVGTPEDVQTLKVIFHLEQLLGKEIVWVRDISFEEMIAQKGALPNQAWRFCTFILKIKPIFEYLQSKSLNHVEMRVGYRYGEQNRMEVFTEDMKYIDSSNIATRRNKWKTVHWRTGTFPLIEHKVVYPQIIEFWKDYFIDFPLDSNCQMCFWKDPQQLRRNFDDNPSVMMWASIQEIIKGKTFRKEFEMLNIKDIGLQQEFVFGGGAGCNSGECIS